MPSFPCPSRDAVSLLLRSAATLGALLFHAASDAAFIDRPISDRTFRETEAVHEGPAVAGNGVDFLAAWTDGRARVYDGTQPAPRQEWDVYGSRISGVGIPAADGGDPFSPSYLRDESPSVIWNGSEYVVVAASTGWCCYTRDSQVIFTPVTDDGPQGRRVIVLPSDTLHLYGGELVAAWNGTHYLVVSGYRWFGSPYEPSATGSVIKAFVADAEFRMVTPVFQISEPFVDSVLPSVASDGHTFLVSWLSAPSDEVMEVRTAVVTAAGVVTRAPAPLDVTPRWIGDAWAAPVIWNGTHYLAAWSRHEAIRGRLLDRGGNPAGDVRTIAETPGVAAFAPSLAWNGSMFLVAFSYRNEWATPASYPVTNLYAARLRPDATLLDVPYPLTVSTVPGEQTVSSVAASGSRFLIVFSSNGLIQSALVDPAVPRVEPPVVVPRGLAAQTNGSGTTIADRFAFLWTEARNVFFGRTALDGTPLDGGGVMLGSGTAHTLVSNGTTLLAVWAPPVSERPLSRELRATRITSDGTVLDTSPIELPEGAGAFASDGHDFLAVSGDGYAVSGSGRVRLQAYRIGSNGSVSRAIALDPGPQFAQELSGVAWNGSHYLVTYRQYFGEFCYRCFPTYETRGILLDASGTPTGTPFTLPISGPVAGADGRFLVVGQAFGADGRNALAYMLVDDQGSVIRTERIDGIAASRVLDVTTEGRDFVIAAGHSLFHLDHDGVLLRETENAIVPDVLNGSLIADAPAARLLIRRLEKLAPRIHEGGIERYFVRSSVPARTRAVRGRH